MILSGFIQLGEAIHSGTRVIYDDHSRTIGIVQIRSVIGDFIAQVDQLRFQRRTQARQVFVQRRNLAGREIPGMLDDPFAHFEGQVQSGKTGVALLEGLHDAQGVQVMVEALSVARHLAVEFLLAGVREWRVADIVRQRQSLRQVFAQAQGRGDGARDLRDLDGVRQPVAEVIG